MITKDYSKGPRVVRKDYVLWKIQNMKESASMPSFCMWPISVFNQEPCGFEIVYIQGESKKSGISKNMAITAT